MGRSGARLPGQETSGSFGPDYVHNGGRPTSSHVNQKEKYILKASQSTVQRRVLSTKGQSCLSAAELVMGHPRNPTAYYLASTLLAYRRLRPKSVHTCSCRCEHKGFAVSTKLLRLHLPVKCEQRILNVLLERYRCQARLSPTDLLPLGQRQHPLDDGVGEGLALGAGSPSRAH